MTVLRIIVCGLCALVLAISVVAFGVIFAISQTILSPEFMISEVEEVDVHFMVADVMIQELPPEADFLIPIIEEGAADLEAWATEQVNQVVRAFSAYLKGQQELRVAISFVEAKEYLTMRLSEIAQGPRPEGFPPVPDEHMETFTREVIRNIDEQLPDTLVIDEAFLGEETMTELRTVRQYTGYAMMALRVLPVIALVMVLLIALMYWWRGRPIAGFTGAALLLGGAVSLAMALAVRALLPDRVLPPDAPPEVALALPDFISRVSQPLLIYGIVLALVGAVLLFVFFRLRSSEM